MIHGRTNHREVQSCRRTDISITDLAQMQRQPEMYLGIAGGAALDISRSDLFRSRTRGSESGRASLARIFVRAQLEDCQHSVAHELERLTALPGNPLTPRSESAVQHLHPALAPLQHVHC